MERVPQKKVPLEDDVLTPEEVADLERDERLDELQQEGDPLEFTEPETGRQLTDEQLAEYLKVNDAEREQGVRWSFRRPLEDMAAQIRLGNSMSHEQAIELATQVFLPMWQRIRAARARGEALDFSEFQAHGCSDDSIHVLRTIIQDPTYPAASTGESGPLAA